MAIQLATAASGVLRDNHRVLNPVTGLYERATLIEGERTNLLPWGEEFDRAEWLKQEVTVTANQATAPDGTNTMDLISRDGTVGSQRIVKTFTASDSANARYAIRLALRAGTLSNAAIFIRDLTLANFPAQTTRILRGPGAVAGQVVSGLSTTEITEIEVVLDAAIAAGTTLSFYVYPGGTGLAAGNLYLWGAQAELGALASSYIKAAVAAPVTRARDDLRLPISVNPRDLTIYLRYVDAGLARELGFARLFSWGLSVGERLSIRSNPTSGRLEMLHETGGSGTSVSSPAVAPARGNLVEVRGIVTAVGSVQLAQSINGGVEQVAAASSILALPASWGSVAYVASNLGSNQYGFIALTHAVIALGTKTRDEMRTLAGVS